MIEEGYFSVDIETDGPIPPDNSMLSFGAALFDKGGNLQSTFSANLETLPGATQNKDTMDWWAKNSEAYAETRKNLIEPRFAMQNFITWVESFDVKPVFVAYPAGFDFNFMYYYMMHFVGRSPFSFSALDIKSYAAAVMKKPYREIVKRNMPKDWFSKTKHTHIALQDAIEQGELFINILKHNLNGQL